MDNLVCSCAMYVCTYVHVHGIPDPIGERAHVLNAKFVLISHSYSCSVLIIFSCTFNKLIKLHIHALYIQRSLFLSLSSPLTLSTGNVLNVHFIELASEQTALIYLGACKKTTYWRHETHNLSPSTCSCLCVASFTACNT